MEVNGRKYAIRSDFRDCLTIIEAYQDEELLPEEKVYVAMDIMYVDFADMPQECYKEAYEKLVWFLNGGGTDEEADEKKARRRLMDWKQDAPLYFPAINKVAGCEIRRSDYMHFWTFLGYYYEIGDGLFATVIAIRRKLADRKKLEKYEKDFYRENKKLVDIKKPMSAEDKEWNDAVEALVNPGGKA
ncbi:MAG: bacteriophage Gp15 family protein [Butyrivibrio sp.]|nr:bacteriophage Gp15 family protein [Butyrivibrio sp.]